MCVIFCFAFLPATTPSALRFWVAFHSMHRLMTRRIYFNHRSHSRACCAVPAGPS
jgi:hypothetical protein